MFNIHWFQYSCTKSRCKGQCNKGRQSHRNSNSQGKLPIQHTHHTTQEGHRHKYCCQYESNSHNRTLYLIHSPLGSIYWGKARTHVVLNILDYHYSIIYYQTNGQYHSKQRQGIDGKVQNDKCHKGTYKRNRHSQQRNNGRPPVLQEYEYNQYYQQQRLEEGLHNLPDGGTNIVSSINNIPQLQIRWEFLLGFCQNLAAFRYSGHCIGIFCQLNTKTYSIFYPIHLREYHILSGTVFNLGHILQMHHGAIAVRLDNNFSKLLRCNQTSIDLAGKLFFLHIADRQCTHRTSRSLQVLLLYGSSNIVNRKIHFRQAVRI